MNHPGFEWVGVWTANAMMLESNMMYLSVYKNWAVQEFKKKEFTPEHFLQTRSCNTNAIDFLWRASTSFCSISEKSYSAWHCGHDQDLANRKILGDWYTQLQGRGLSRSKQCKWWTHFSIITLIFLLLSEKEGKMLWIFRSSETVLRLYFRSHENMSLLRLWF